MALPLNQATKEANESCLIELIEWKCWIGLVEEACCKHNREAQQ